MSRGGRGGGRGGGGFGRGKMGGVDLPWEYDPELEIKTKPTELFPPIPPPIAPPGRRSEKAQVTRYRALRDRIHEGPLYTILGDTVRVGKSGPPSAALFDPFLGMPTYTQKYMKQRRKIPRLDTRPYVMRFFPEELWSILDPTHATGNGNTPPKKKPKLLQISKSTTMSRLERMEQEEARKQNDEDEEDEENEKERDDDGLPQELEDNDYEDDEEDDDDYNAENYFDNGEKDYDDGGGNDGYYDGD